MSVIRPFSNDDECDEVQQVGSGCAELTPHEDTRAALTHAVRMVRTLRKAGATYVKIGDIEVSFMEQRGERTEG